MEEEKEEKTYILGGGIAGLIWAFYNDGKIISPEFGGQMASHFPLGPRFLHHNEYSEKLLKDLDMPIELITVKTGYYDGEIAILDKIPSEEYKQKYYMKSRGREDLEGYDDTAMSSGHNSFQAIKVDFAVLIEKLKDRLWHRFIQEKVISIDARTICTNKQTINYDNIVNTMPLNIFSNAYLGEFLSSDNFKSEAMTYVWLKRGDAECDFDYIYYPFEQTPHHRITVDDKGLICEWFGKHTPEECKAAYGEDYVDSQILYNAQIIPCSKPIKADRTLFVGRYGTWNRHWKTETVIEEALKVQKFMDGEFPNMTIREKKRTIHKYWLLIKDLK